MWKDVSGAWWKASRRRSIVWLALSVAALSGVPEAAAFEAAGVSDVRVAVAVWACASAATLAGFAAALASFRCPACRKRIPARLTGGLPDDPAPLVRCPRCGARFSRMVGTEASPRGRKRRGRRA